VTNFFAQPMIPSTVPAPEPAGFDLLRQMLMNKSFQGNSNPYGLNPDYKGGASSVYTNGQNQGFNPYGGGAAGSYGQGGGGGWHSHGFGPAQQGGGGMSHQMPPGGGMQGGPGGGGFMQFIQQLMQQMKGGGGARTMPMRPGGGGLDDMMHGGPPRAGTMIGWSDKNPGPPPPDFNQFNPAGDGAIPGPPPTATAPPQSPSPSLQDNVPDRSRAGFDGIVHYDGDGCGFDGDPYSGFQPGRFSTPQSIKPKDQAADSGTMPPPTSDNSQQSLAPQSVWISGQSSFDGAPRMSHDLGLNRTSVGPRMGGPSGGMRQLNTILGQLRPQRGPSPFARVGRPMLGVDPSRGGLR